MDPNSVSLRDETAAEATALSRLLAKCRSADLTDLFDAMHLPTPTLLWRPKFVDLHHPVLKGFQRALGASTQGRYPVEWLSGPDFEAIKESMIVLEPLEGGEDFVYRHYGARIRALAGRDMADRRVSDLAAEYPQLAIFFLAVYRAVVERAEPVKSDHAAPKAPLTRQWRRLIVPLIDATGRVSRIAVSCAADNELRAGLEILPDGVIVADATGRVAFANRPARRLLDIGGTVLADMSFADLTGAEFDLPARPEDVILERNRMVRRVRKVQGTTIVPLEFTIGANYFRGDPFYVIFVREVMPARD